jgi:serine phosphatase RsbU (regulator of sigma subunit)
VDDTPESDDGLDAAFLWFDTAAGTLSFAGANLGLHILAPGAEQFESHAGQRMGVGYVNSDLDYQWPISRIAVAPNSLVFITTDGLIDQVGGPKKISLGKRNVFKAIVEHREKPTAEICSALQRTLAGWQQGQTRRDDVTFFCARLLVTSRNNDE